MIATPLGEPTADVGGRRDARNNQQRRSGASGREEPALLAARTGRVLPARLPLCVAGFMVRAPKDYAESVRDLPPSIPLTYAGWRADERTRTAFLLINRYNSFPIAWAWQLAQRGNSTGTGKVAPCPNR